MWDGKAEDAHIPGNQGVLEQAHFHLGGVFSSAILASGWYPKHGGSLLLLGYIDVLVTQAGGSLSQNSTSEQP